MFKVANLSAGYGRVDVLHGVSLEVPEAAVVGLLGPNGAGKTTLVNAICGLVPRRTGTLEFEGRSLERLRPEKIVRLGIIQVPQGRLLFPELTVEENLEMGAYLSEARRKLRGNLSRVQNLFPVLAERRRQLAGTLSGGEQQMLAIARGLMSCPRFLMLDEPSLGLAPLLVNEIFSVILRINTESTTILLAEQNVRKVLTMAQRCYVLENGRIAIQGRAADLLEDEQVRKSYLGIH